MIHTDLPAGVSVTDGAGRWIRDFESALAASDAAAMDGLFVEQHSSFGPVRRLGPLVGLALHERGNGFGPIPGDLVDSAVDPDRRYD